MADGRFKPGQVANPSGRPKGAKNKRTLVALALDAAAEGVTAAVIEAAKGGDMQAAKLVLERVQPPVRPVTERTPFDLDMTASPSTQAAQVIQAMADGALPADIAHTVLDCLHKHAALLQAETLEDRITALERGLHLPGAAPSGIKFIPMQEPQP